LFCIIRSWFLAVPGDDWRMAGGLRGGRKGEDRRWICGAGTRGLSGWTLFGGVGIGFELGLFFWGRRDEIFA